MIGKLVKTFTMLALALLFLIMTGLIWKSIPLLANYSPGDLLFGTEWSPRKDLFGFAPFIISTLYVTVIATVIAIPLSLLTAVYLSEYASKRVVSWASPMLDIMAGIPSVIFGIWGILIVVPFIRDYLAVWFGIESVSGYSVLAGGIVLAIMVFPIMVQLVFVVLKTVPTGLREAALSLGANKTEMILKVVIKKASAGILAASILGFSRAFGETLAVLMVVGNVVQMPKSLFDSGYPIPALIANNYGEMMSIPMYDAALMFAALILLLIIVLFNISARSLLSRWEKRIL